MSTRAYKIKVAVCAATGLAVIGIATGLTAWLLPPPASCVESSRNPYRFRDWVHYVDGMDARGDAACVVLISDSQAYAGDYPSRQGYPARLEALLNERKPGGHERWEVLNLSLDGVTTPEYMILAARLREEQPTWLVSVSGCADFKADNFTRSFSYCRTDLPHFLTQWSMMRRMSLAFWRRHGRVEDALTAWVAHRFPLLQFRDFLWSWIDTRYPGAQKAFYAPRTTYHFWQLPGKARIAPVAAPMPDGKGDNLDLTYDERSRVMMREFLAQLAAVPAEHRLVVAAPMRSNLAGAGEGPWVAAFRKDLEQLSGEAGLPFWDMTEALPPEDFLNSSHLQDRNHKRMAVLLEERIAAEMGK